MDNRARAILFAVISAVIVSAMVVLNLTTLAGSNRTKVDQPLAEKGISGALSGLLPSASPKPTTITLGCGPGYEEPPIERSVMVSVPPCLGGMMTAWLKRPSTAPGFWVEPLAKVDLQKHFADGTTEAVSWDPLNEKRDTKKLTGVRFQNPGPKPILVRIRLK